MSTKYHNYTVDYYDTTGTIAISTKDASVYIDASSLVVTDDNNISVNIIRWVRRTRRGTNRLCKKLVNRFVVDALRRALENNRS